MKKFINLKFFSLILVLALGICGVIGISTGAEEATLAIDSANVAYNDMMHLAFTLKNTKTLPDGAEAGIIIWNGAKEEYTVDNASYVTFDSSTKEDTIYFKSEGIAAPQIGNVIYIAACYNKDGNVTVTQTPFDYSIVEYLASRLNSNATNVQAELYENVLIYGAASDTILDNDGFVLVRTFGGYVGDYNRTCGAAKEVGASFLLRAPAANAEGKYFVKWVDAEGATVSEDRIFSVTPADVGISAYTAVFGDGSAYSYVHSFEDKALGEVDLGTPDLTAAPTIDCYGNYSGTNMKRWGIYFSGYENTTLLTYALPEATVVGTTAEGKNIYEFTKDADGKYIVAAKDSCEIVENAQGDKSLGVHRGQFGSGYELTFKNTGDATVAEVDLSFADLTSNGVQISINLSITDGTTSSTYRTNLFGNSVSNKVKLYGEESSSGLSDNNQLSVDGEVLWYSVDVGKTVTFKIVLNVTGTTPCLDYYVNGEYAGSLNCDIFGGHKAATDLANARISALNINSVTAARDSIYIDNVNFK